MLALIGITSVFVVAKASISPVPLADKPIKGLLFDHSNVVPAPTGLETGTEATPTPSQ